MVETYKHEARVKLANAEMAQAYGKEFLEEATETGYKGWDSIAKLISTSEWKMGLAICIHSLKEDLGL